MSATEIWTIVLSSFALVASVYSIGWQVVRARSDAPLVTMSGRVSYSVLNEDYDHPMWAFELRVSNAGRLPVTVERVGWSMFCSGGPLHVSGGDISETTPLRLEANDSRSWEFDNRVRGTLCDGLFGQPTAMIVRQPTWREKRRGLGVHHAVSGPIQQLFIPTGHGSTDVGRVSTDSA